jgi:hypothetical protein
MKSLKLHIMLVVLGQLLAVCIEWGQVAVAAEFEATYAELAPSPLNAATTWYSGAVTRDGKFLYGLGNSHNAYGNNSLWLYEPGTDRHANVFPNTGGKWRWDRDTKKQAIASSGHWAKLDPVADKALFDFFGGSDIKALTNRNNHQAFYVPARDEFWVLAGTTFYQSSPYFGGRFNMKTQRWTNLSTNLAEFSAGLIAGSGEWVAPNAATAVCADLNTVVLFGGMHATGGVCIIEPNPDNPEPYRWASAPKPPIYQPAENVRHNAVCVGDTVYFISGQERVPDVKCCRTPDPAAFWKFHVPSRKWTRLPDGPAGAYFTLLTHDSDAGALLVYGGSASNRLWVYDLAAGQWHDLTGSVSGLPRADMHTGGFVPGFGHIVKGGKRYDANGKDLGYGASAKMLKIVLRRLASEQPPVKPASAPVDPSPGSVQPSSEPTPVDPTPDPEPPAPVEPETSPAPVEPVPTEIAWAKIPLPGKPRSPQGSMKHQRLVEGPKGRVYILGGDWGGDWGNNSGRQEVYSFDPLSDTGDWRLEAPYCGTKEHPVHWHTDEAGVAWDAKRGVFWKIAGTEYGPDDSCLAAGGSFKAKVATFDPATKKWAKPTGFDQTRFGFVTNGVLDPVRDEMVQIIDKAVKRLNLETGQWSTTALPGGAIRFNVIAARVGRSVWWANREQVLESFNLDTGEMTTHEVTPWSPPTSSWEMQIVMPVGDRVLVVRPTSRADTHRHAAFYDPAARRWTTLDPGEGWGNTGMVHSSGRLVLMGGGIDGPAHHNKFVWVGNLP